MEKIQQIGNELIKTCIMKEIVENELKTIAKRWEGLNRQAKERLNELETSMSESQCCERQLLTLQKWIQNVDSELQSSFENDVLPEDIPDKVEVS